MRYAQPTVRLRFKDLRTGELLAMVGAALLIASVFLPWYHLGNANASLYGAHGPNLDVSAVAVLNFVPWLLVVTALAPFVLAYIVVRGHRLSWPRGEVSALFAILALFIVLIRGYFVKPGTPPMEINLAYGWFVSLAATFIMLIGAGLRRALSEDRRKPPGTL